VATAEDTIGFERDIKPLFRERDRASMSNHFDLWSYDDVRNHSDAILDQVSAGSMPCDGAWAPERVDLFEEWVRDGMAP
jgi:hypothetical protein